MTLLLLFGGAGEATIVDGQDVNALATSTLLHAQKTIGELEYLVTTETMENQNGDTLVNQSGDTLIARALQYSIVLHTGFTEPLLHAEQTVGEADYAPVVYSLINQNGDTLVNQNGDTLVAAIPTLMPVLHTGLTETLLHAEYING